MSFDETLVTYREKTAEATFFSTRVRVSRITRGSILDPFSFRLASSLLQSGLVRHASLTIECARIYKYYTIEEGFAISKEPCTTVARGGIAIAVQDPEASRPRRFSFSRESNAMRAFSALSVIRSKLEGIVIFVLTTSTLRMRVHIYICVCAYMYIRNYICRCANGINIVNNTILRKYAKRARCCSIQKNEHPVIEKLSVPHTYVER